MHAAFGGWEGCVCVCTCVSIDPSLWWLDAGGVPGCLHHYWAVRHKAGGNKKIYQCNRNPREDYGINKKRMNNRALSPQTALSRVPRVLMQAPVSGPCAQGESVRALSTCGKISHLHACVHKQKRPQSNAKCIQEYYERFYCFYNIAKIARGPYVHSFVYYW